MPTTKRLVILSESEIQTLFARPSFSSDDREFYFSLDPDETLIFESFRQTNAKLLFLIQLGYFKATHRFFVFSWNEVLADCEYLLQRYFLQEALPKTIPSKNTRLAQQKIILQCHNYRSFGQREHRWISDKAQKLAKIHVQPRFLLTELLQILDTERITVPGYSTFQKVIGASTNHEQQRLSACIKGQVPENIKTTLNDLLVMEGSFYQLTALKKRAKDFRLKHVRNEIQKHTSISHLYNFSNTFLPKLEISNENIRYYASLTEYYPVHRLKNMEDNQTQLYLLCFIKHCFEQISDNLITCFIYQVTSIEQAATEIGKQKLGDYHLEHQKQLRQTRKLIQLFVDQTIDDQIPFREVKKRAFDIMDEQVIRKVVEYLSGNKLDRQYYEWAHIQKNSRKMTINIRPLFIAIDFNSPLENDFIIDVTRQLKAIHNSGKSSNIETLQEHLNSIIPEKTKNCMTHSAHYEFFIYQQLKNGLEAGDIFYSGSTRFKSFDDDLVSKQEMKAKKMLLKSLGYPVMNMPIDQRLSVLRAKLEQRYKEVNNNILNGKNPHLKFSKKNDEIQWKLPYKKQEDTVNNPFYEQLPQVGIVEVLHYVNTQCHFLEAFRHIQPRYSKRKASDAHMFSLHHCLWRTHWTFHDGRHLRHKILPFAYHIQRN